MILSAFNARQLRPDCLHPGLWGVSAEESLQLFYPRILYMWESGSGLLWGAGRSQDVKKDTWTIRPICPHDLSWGPLRKWKFSKATSGHMHTLQNLEA